MKWRNIYFSAGITVFLLFLVFVYIEKRADIESIWNDNYHKQYYLLEAALDKPEYAEYRKVISINMERWKSMPENLGEKYIWVNIADLSVELIEQDSVRFRSKAIVGTTFRKTPVLNAQMTYLVLNPTWYIPPNILRKDILPQVLKNPEYLKKKNIRVFQKGLDGVSQEVLTDTINWEVVRSNPGKYQFIQDAGKDNALGDVKFIFPNSLNVYLHDTPTRNLFDADDRAFSSGCIRVQNALDLAELLLKDKWGRNDINRIIHSQKTTYLILPKPVNIYLNYFTAWVNDAGVVEFRKDIYKWDELLSYEL